MYGSSYSLFESNWNYDLSFSFVMQISPSIILYHNMLDLHDKEV